MLPSRRQGEPNRPQPRTAPAGASREPQSAPVGGCSGAQDGIERYRTALFGSAAFVSAFSIGNGVIFVIIDALPQLRYGEAYLVGAAIVTFIAISFVLFLGWFATYIFRRCPVCGTRVENPER